MGLDLEYLEGQTPLDDDEKEGLRILTIATRGELDEFEQKNIEEALAWTMAKRVNAHSVLTEKFIKDLHKKMYGDVWAWAGEFRKTNKNIGVDKWQISTALHNLLDDAKYWIDNNTYPPDEIAIRFKHRLVSIHCFPNGNGRHSRLMADVIAKVLKQPDFTWGNTKDINQRQGYLEAVRTADKEDYIPLMQFARS
jgi:Fic-DOC domain mobile mystery protein B